MNRVRALIETLALVPHPEGGHYARTYQGALTMPAHGGVRSVASAIYFLLAADQGASYLHRLKSDELFHFYEGGPLQVLLLPQDPAGARVATLGLDLAAGQRPQLVIPAGTWFGAALAPGATHCLWGCTVAPGFDFADFELAHGPELAQRFPAFADLIGRMTRPG
jgi:predicted cupin superfamily sugar epimerase